VGTASFLSRLVEYHQSPQEVVCDEIQTFQVFTDTGDRSHAEI